MVNDNFYLSNTIVLERRQTWPLTSVRMPSKVPTSMIRYFEALATTGVGSLTEKLRVTLNML